MALVWSKPTPLAEAVARMSAKTPIGSVLKSADWLKMPIALRERAFFSATIECAEFLQAAQSGILEMAQMARRHGGSGAIQNPQALVADLMEIAKRHGLAPADPAKRGGLEDPTSLRRLNLIVNFNAQQASEFAHWKVGQDPDILDAYPCQELVRIEHRDQPRGGDVNAAGVGAFWRRKWSELGGQFFEGRMIARKDDTIWRRLSRFGTPFPPFDFESGLGLEDVSRDEAERLGIINADDVIAPQDGEFNDALEASVTDLRPQMQTALTTIFGDQVEIEDGRARWRDQDEREAA
jgi:hypothetical protein